MAKIQSSFMDISSLDLLSYRETPIHRLDPRAKLLTTMAFVVAVVSFDKYALVTLVPFVLYPVVIITVGNLPLGTLLKRMLLAVPFAFFIGIFNPLFDRTVVMEVGSIGISGGWISFASIMMRFSLTVSAALILIATTGMNGICMGLEKMGAPRLFVLQLLFLYRYLFVLTDEALRMSRARSLRSFNEKGKEIGVFARMTGRLLMRTLDRAQRIHQAMLSRGFDGEIRLLRPLHFQPRDAVFVAGWTAFFVLSRIYDLPHLLGKGMLEFIA
ncbi:MAG: cobalt ECF transporter T component CbiQ [Syntrophobacteraceae bacterium]|nr:cobalt ECF transporter T component CbiQ [Syntrophobacteraceae bacterium]